MRAVETARIEVQPSRPGCRADSLRPMEPETCAVCGAILTEDRGGELIGVGWSEDLVWIHPGCKGRERFDHYPLARERQKQSEVGIGVAYIGEVTEPDRDGWVGKVVATDGGQDKEFDVILSGTRRGHRGMAVDQDAIALAVEAMVNTKLPAAERLQDLADRAPLMLPATAL